MKTNTAKKSAPKEITFQGIGSIPADKREKVGVIPGDIYTWLKDKAGNNPANVIIRPVQGLDNKNKSPAYGVKGLIDALNGGQSPSAKTTWGRNYVELVVKK